MSPAIPAAGLSPVEDPQRILPTDDPSLAITPVEEAASRVGPTEEMAPAVAPVDDRPPALVPEEVGSGISLRSDGTPFVSQKSAAMAARFRKIEASPVKVEGGWGLQPVPPGEAVLRAEEETKEPVGASEPEIKVEPVSVNDTHQGEMFGTKVLRVGGIGQAIADINILDDEVSIRDIKTDPAVRGKGYAKRLVDDLFNEFPGQKITITNTTEDGAGFFEKNYDVDEEQRIYPKGEAPLSLKL